MASVNRVTLLGNLGQDPEIRYTPTGQAVCNFSVATTESWTDREGNKQSSTEWHRVVVWNKQAENCSKYLAKGRSVYVEGKLQTRSWDDKTTGQKRFATDIVAQTVQFVGGNPRENGQSQQMAPSQGAPQQQGQYNYQNQFESSGSPSSDPFPDMGSFGGPATPNLDEIPF